MSIDRRQFLWTMGTAAGALSLVRLGEFMWPAPPTPTGPGWTPGIEELLRSTCLLCPSRCGIQGRVVDGKLVRITGNELHPMSRGGICRRGVAGVQMLYHPDRITSPLVREGARGEGKWRKVSSDEAIAQVTEKLQGLRNAGRPEALAGLSGYGLGSMDDLWRRFFEAFGSPNHVVDGHDDGTASVMAAMHGVHRRPGYDLENAEVVLSFGAPLFEAWWSPVQAYAAFAASTRANGARRRFIQVDQRFSETAAHADEWVGVRPGTHWILALGMAYVILRDRLHDQDFLARHVSGFEDFTDARGRAHEGFRSVVMRRYRTEEVSAQTGVSVERITELARAFAASPRSVAVCGQDVMLAPEGLTAGMAVHSLNALVGSIGRTGGVVFGDEPPLAPLGPLVHDGVSRSSGSRAPIGGSGPAFGAGDRAARFADAVATGQADAPEVLFLSGADPLGSSRVSEAWKEALSKIPFVVSFSPFLDHSAIQADVIIPDLLPWERWQDAPTPSSYLYPVWGIAHPLVTPPEGPMHTGDVLLGLARKLGGSVAESLPYDSFEALLKSRAQGLFDAHRGSIFADGFITQSQHQRELRGWWLPSQPDFDSFWSELVEKGGWVDPFYDDTSPGRFARTRNGRVALMPQEVLDALAEDGRQPYVKASDEGEDDPADFPLLLLPYRVTPLTSHDPSLERWLAEQPAVLPDVQWVPWVLVSPAAAEAMGLEAGHMVWVVSPRGRYRARLQTSVGIAPGTVAAPVGLRHPDGEVADPRRLLADSNDPLTGLPAWFTTQVRLETA